MSRVSEMRGLTEDLARSHDERMADLRARGADVKSALEATRSALEATRQARVSEAADLRKQLGDDASGRREAVANMLSGVLAERSALAASQRSALARARAERVAEDQERSATTQGVMQQIHTSRVAEEATLAAKLHHDLSDLRRRVADLMGGGHQDRAAMASEQNAALSHGHATLAAETKGFLGEVRGNRASFAQAQREALGTSRAELRAEVSTTLAEYSSDRAALRGDLAESSQVWQGFAQSMQAARAAVASSPPVGPGETTPPSPTPAAAEQPASPPPASAPTVESHGPPTDQAVFSYLADHPDGLRLVELEEHFRTARIRLVPIVARLIEENKARKDEERKVYFAT